MGTVSNRRLAVVTGASSGIGFQLARECVERGFDVVICAEDEGIIDAAARLDTEGAFVLAVRANLATYDGVQELVNAINATGRPVDALLLNAGVGVGGEFVETDLVAELRMIALSCLAVVVLAKRVLPSMKARGEGRVLITTSVVSTALAPFAAVYAATRAFDLSFAEALRVELADTGVTVTALQPGATDTDVFERACLEDTRVGQSETDDPAEVAKEGIEAMLAGKRSVIAA